MVRGTAYLMIAEAMFVVSGWVIHVGSKRILGLADYGTFGILLSLLTLYRIFLASGVNRAVSRYISREPELARSIRRQALKLQITIGAVLCLAIWLAAPGLSRIWRNDAFTGYIRLTGFFLPIFGAYAVYRGTLNGYTLFGQEARVSIIYSLSKIAFVFLLIFLFGYWGGERLYGAVTGYLAAIAAAVILARAACPPGELIPGRVFPIREIVRFAFPVVLFSFIISLIQHLDLYFVRARAGDGVELAAGWYTCAQQFARIPYMLLYALSLTLFPNIAASTAAPGGEEITAGMIRQALRGGIFLVLPMAALIGGAAAPLVGWVYGADSVEAGGALQILIFGQTLLALLMVLTTIITAQGRPWLAFLLVTATLLLDAVLNYFLIPVYGIRGAALATTIAAGVGMAGAGVVVCRRFHALFPPLPTVKIALAAALLFLLARWWSPSGWMILPAFILLSALYLLLLLAARESDRSDLNMLQLIFSSKK
ncbi:MAG: oligosaccharide flippase family protein [PVC group bacterium]